MGMLEVIRAGAGSGKTTDLCETVAIAVGEGLDPARLLATTYTRKAAAELKGRIQAKLLVSSDTDLAASHRRAERLELAAIGTVHSVAHQLITRYALHLGLSPRLDVLDERGSDRALREHLGTMATDAWEKLASTTDRLSIANLQARILKLLAAKRGNRISDADFSAQMRSSADRVCELLARNGPRKDATSFDRLYELADEALKQLNARSNDTTGDTTKARQTLGRLTAQHSGSWNNYVHAVKIKAGKKSGADKCLDDLRAHAARVRQEPKLHADIHEFVEKLAAETIRLENHYQEYKKERGLVDFTDLEIIFLGLLDNTDLAESLSADYQLILVDEFQDTNPLQLAIFQRLRDLAERSRWVGDPKQAIYGFRDTDPRLVNDVWENAPEAHRETLPRNYRSQKGLVQLVGRLFKPVFGEDAVQEPHRGATARGIERWIFQTKNQGDDALALACGIAKTNSEGVRFGDIAVLGRTNRQLGEIGIALEQLGIPYLIESPGLLATREGAITLAGLRLVADRSDSLAAAMILHILSEPGENPPAWISERLEELVQSETLAVEGGGNGSSQQTNFVIPWEGDARFLPLEEIDHRTLPPLIIVQQVMESLGVPALVSGWGDAGRRSSHLDSLLRLAAEYEQLCLEIGTGATLTGLISHLEQLALDQKDMRLPPLGHDAVTLLTYHSAKGLEWPVVVLAGLDFNRNPDLWSPTVTGADPIIGRTVRSWTWPFGESDGPYGGLLQGSGLGQDALNSPEGQDQSQREQEESLRLLYVGFTRAKDKVVLGHRVGRYSWLGQLPTVDQVLDPVAVEGEHDLPGIDTGYVVRRLSAAEVDDCRKPLADFERWLTTNRTDTTTTTTERYHSPSHVPSPVLPPSFNIESLTGSSTFPSGSKEEQYVSIGNATHAYLAALPSLRNLNLRQKEEVASRCLSGFSATGLVDTTAVVTAGERFVEWVKTRYPDAEWHTEVPVTAPRHAGGQWNGTIDLLLTLADGSVVVIDHKSAPIQGRDCEAKAETFAGQLLSYQESLHVLELDVRSCWIHFPFAGVMAEMARKTD